MFSLLSRICKLSKQTLHLLRPRRSLLTFMVFLVLSGLFWLSTALNESYDCEVAVPLFLENIPKNVIVTSDVEDTLRVTVHDKGYAIMEYLYGDKVTPVRINVPTLSKESGRYVVTSAELLRLVRKQLNAFSSVTSVKPERLEVVYCHGSAKKVAVRLDGNIVPAANYYLSHVQITPEKVTVYAAKQLLDSITYVTTEPLQMRNFTDSVSLTATLKTVKGARITPQTVKVELFPDILTEGTADVPITVVNLPEGVNVRTFPLRVKVKYSVGVSLFRSVNTSQFRVEMDYNEIRSGSDKCPLHLTKMPQGITKASLEFAEVDYLIEN
jgi:YbbR domain-containing protein